MMEEEDLTEDIIRQVIAELPDEFDSHEFLRKLMTIEPRVYTALLKKKLDSDIGDPIQVAHSGIGRKLSDSPLLEKGERRSSMNVRGQKTDNQVWRKRP